MKIPPWLYLHPYAVLFVIGILLVGVYLIYRLRMSRKADDVGEVNHPLRQRFLYLYILIALVIVLKVINHFRGVPSQEQVENAQKVATENGLKWQAWQISHPYAVPLFILILSVVIFTICLARVFRKAGKGGLRAYISNPLTYFCIAMVIAFCALLISFFQL